MTLLCHDTWVVSIKKIQQACIKLLRKNMKGKSMEINVPAYSLNGETNPAKWDGILSETVEGATKYCGPTKRNAD